MGRLFRLRKVTEERDSTRAPLKRATRQLTPETAKGRIKSDGVSFSVCIRKRAGSTPNGVGTTQEGRPDGTPFSFEKSDRGSGVDARSFEARYPPTHARNSKKGGLYWMA